LRYEGYIERQHREIERQIRFESLSIPIDINFTKIRGLSNEAVQILRQHRPATLGQAGRISGVTPATISLLLVYLKNRFSERTAA
jgi:tRNA uridine 5-carboxymethylaminomethyl modification enzyme